MNILFITSNRVGDAVLSTGLLAWLERRYPEARFTIACGPYAAGLFRAVPRLDGIIILQKQSWNRHWIKLWRACVNREWDLIVDLRNSLVSRLLRAKDKRYAARLPDRHKVIENATALNLNPPPAPHIWLDAAARHAAAEILPASRPLLAIGPAANWPAKQWPIERFTVLVQKLTAPDGPLPGAKIMIIADSRESDQLKPLRNAIPADQRIEVIGRDLLTAAACLKQARLFIGNDSGLMHIAAAMGTPTLGLFGPGYENIYGPWGEHAGFVRTDESRENLLKQLPHPGAHHPNLMTSLSVEKVEAAMRRLLADNPMNKIAE
jgi:lipopolysaccharide export system permease protein